MKQKRILIYLTILLVWIIFIFCRSLQPAETSTFESQWVLDLLQRIIPFELSMHFIRKLAHFIEFAVLGVLAGLLFGGQCRRLLPGLLFSAMTGVITALCDETIQLFVAGRSGQLQDVWLDVAGASAGAVLALSGRAIIRRKRGAMSPIN